MDRQQKAEFVETMHTRLQDVSAMFLTDFRGMSVSEDAELRSKLREAGVEMTVVKNRLFKLALAETQFEGVLDDLLVGPNAVLFTEDVVAGAKALAEYLKEHDEATLEIKGGAMGDTALTADEIRELATMPSRDQLLAKFVGLLQTPLRDFTVLLQSPLRDVASVLRALEQKKSEEQ